MQDEWLEGAILEDEAITPTNQKNSKLKLQRTSSNRDYLSSYFTNFNEQKLRKKLNASELSFNNEGVQSSMNQVGDTFNEQNPITNNPNN